MLQELGYAARWNAGQPSSVFSDHEFVDAVTTTPAQMAKVADKIGRIAPGTYADFLVVRRPAGVDPYIAVVRSVPGHRPTSAFHQKHDFLFRHLIDRYENDAGARRIFRAWVGNTPVAD